MLLSALVAAALQFSSSPAVGSVNSSIANPSISADEMAVYEAVLSSWLGKEHGRQLVDERLSAAPSKTDPELRECMKGLDLSAPAQGSHHSLVGVRFQRPEIELVDGSKWIPADPMQRIASGQSVEAALKEAFSKSLISFSQIAFSRDGNDALVSFGMVCGGTCGSGSTMHLHKSESGWAVLSRCKEWES